MSEQHMASIQALLREQRLGAALLCDPGRNGIGQWVTESVQTPVLPPFGRNSMLILFADGRVCPVSAQQPHPTDPEQHPLFRPELLKDSLDQGRLGVINGDRLNAGVLEQLKAYFGPVELVELTRESSRLQARRGEKELALMREAAKRYDRLFSALPLVLRQERLEASAVTEIRCRGMQLGLQAEDLGLLIQVWLTSAQQQGAAGEEPLHWPGRRLTWNDRVGVRVAGPGPEGVHAALGRCYTIGSASAATKRAWETALAVQDAAAACLKPGETLTAAAKSAGETAKARGAVLAPGLWLHGVGWGWQEHPRNIDPSGELPLEENMTILVAPSVRLGEEAPYCCMDVYQVTPEGGVRLGKTSRALVEL